MIYYKLHFSLYPNNIASYSISGESDNIITKNDCIKAIEDYLSKWNMKGFIFNVELKVYGVGEPLSIFRLT